MRWVVVVGTVLAMVGASLWVPVQFQQTRWGYPAGGPSPWLLHRQFEWIGDRDGWGITELPQPPAIQSADRLCTVVAWHVLITEQALILLLGGGLLTWMVRRERRREAAA